MLNDTFAVTDKRSECGYVHKIRASSVGRVSVFIKLQVEGLDFNGSFFLLSF